MKLSRLRQIGQRSLLLLPLLALGAQALGRGNEVRFNIDPGSAPDSLQAFIQQAQVEVLYSSDEVSGRQTHGVTGDLRPADALARMLTGSGLTFRFINNRTIVVAGERTFSRATEAAPEKSATDQPRASSDESKSQLDIEKSDQPSTVATIGTGAKASSNTPDQNKKNGTAGKVDEVVVTGTYIRGTDPTGSPVKSYTRQDIDESGASTIDQFARLLPENFANTDRIANVNSNTRLATLSGNGSNQYNGSAFNLHGLGTTSTLTLVNGHRLAPAGLDGGLTDVSMIPLGAIDHIEVLTDGASAIYGADAVAGVVNIITRKDYQGAETNLRYGGATDGGGIEKTASQLLGGSWGTGGVFANYEYDDQGPLDASQRNYIADQGGPNELIAHSRRNSVFASLTQFVGNGTKIHGDIAYSKRDFSQPTTISGTDFLDSSFTSGHASNLNAVLSADQRLGATWQLEMTGNFSRVQQDSATSLSQVVPGFSYVSNDSTVADATITSADLRADGSLFSISSGEVKLALGGTWRNEKFDSQNITTSVFGTSSSPVPALQRHVGSIYTELLIPLMNGSAAIPGVSRLELSLAGRYDRYSDFGSSANPKFGLLWEPVTGFSLRTSYGTSFQAPLLSQLGSPLIIDTLPLIDSGSPSETADVVAVQGGNPNLGPQKSRSVTAGFDFRPPALSGFSASMTYFHVRFTNRVSTPPSSVGGLYDIADPLLAPFVVRNPSAEQIAAYFNSPAFIGDYAGLGAAGVQAVLDERYANIAATKQSGVDVSAEYTMTLPLGSAHVGASAERLLRNDFQTVDGGAFFTLLNEFGQPPRWRGRANFSWSYSGLVAAAYLNYINSYQNTLQSPPQPIQSWTTEDLYLSYDSGNASGSKLYNHVRVAISITNVTDERPPAVQVPPVVLGQNPLPFDPANASPLGRVIGVSLTKQW